MALTRKVIFVVAAKRTPFCKYGGYLQELPSSHAFAAAAKAAINSAKLNSTLVDCTVIGNVNFLSQCDGGKTPRYCGLYSGVPIEKPALGVNKACGSGLQALITGSLEISTGSAKVCLTGGTEIMSSLPFLVRNVRFGSSLGVSYNFEDHIKGQVLDSYTDLTLQKLAEIVAEKYRISREMADDFAYKSFLKWKAVAPSKILQEELTSISVPFKKTEIIVERDELDTNSEFNNFLSAPTILTDGTVVTALNSAAPADGAAALVLSDEESTRSNNMTPLARVVAYSCVGADPTTGLGAAVAIRRLLDVTGIRVDEVDLFEINETFATQVLATIKELKLEENKVNIGGGALALGHPVAASGARMAVHLVHQLNRGNKKRAIAASSCGAGQGIAVMFESI
ncbi:jg9627 [Pararge aegeria aegeria]|uniref:Jg9627 protein n=1 Tax=Pararge aegeria aegeria TaxID=348720 RepID=A0A8S4RR84_9NEOP|nr:jg9627 [Pararge aegeria aegeria]